jgi:LysM repeat protein
MHTLTNKIYRLIPLLLCFFCALQAWSVEDVALPPEEAPPTIHVVVKGEKLSDLAEKYLGHKRYAPELLRYNDVDNPRQITAGYVLSIPGPERKRCVDRLAELEQRIKQVEPLELKTYATGEYKIAFQMLESARKQLANTGYARGIKYCELADEALDLAIKAGRLAEIAEQTWVVESIFGEVHVSNDNQANWKRVQVGKKLAPKSILRTGANSKVAVKFHDGSRVELEENSIFSATHIVRRRQLPSKFDLVQSMLTIGPNSVIHCPSRRRATSPR